MKHLTAKTRISIGMICLLLSLLAAIASTGIGPNERHSVMSGRASLAETVAIGCSMHLNHRQFEDIKTLLNGLVKRNSDILSAGVRESSGRLVIDVNDHDKRWTANVNASETHVAIPVQMSGKRWGQVEILFSPTSQAGFWGWIENPWAKYMLMAGGLGFFVIYIYLGYVLKQLDPAQAVPKRVRVALNALTEGLILTDKKGRVLLANDTFSNWIGQDPEKLFGMDAASFPWMLDAANSTRPTIHSRTPLRLPWVLAFESQCPRAGELIQLRNVDGKCLTLVANSSPILGPDGQYRGVLTSFDDVTELEEHKSELSKAKLAADQANRAKSEFLARMSHEIRTPMNAILGYTEIMLNGLDDDRNRDKHLATIQHSGQHLLDVINDILDLSKVESGQMKLEMRWCPLKDVLANVVSVLDIKASEKGIHLKCFFHGPVPEVVYTDEVRLKQILINLIGNAIKFTEQGGVTLHVEMSDSGRSPVLRLDVVDTGIGMTPSQLTKIFDPFSQADTSITRKYGGTGLGLAICKQLVERLQGSIHVDSIPSQGSRFSVEIDPGCLDKVAMIRIEGDLKSDLQQKKAVSAAYDFGGKRILVVEDGQSNRELVGLLLRKIGAIVEFAENGRDGVDRCGQSDYDAILMDLHMPVMDGVTATQALRQSGCRTPIIALTADAMRDDEKKCLQAGFTGFLAKPINSERLYSKLAEVMSAETIHLLRDLPSSNPQTNTHVNGQDRSLSEDGCGRPSLDVLVDDTDAVEHEIVHTLSAETAAVQAAIDVSPLVSTLPVDDEDFRQIVDVFVASLMNKAASMQKALQVRDYKELAELAHWLKGSGGTAGFDLFTEPAHHLKQSADAADPQGSRQFVKQILELIQRIRSHGKGAPEISDPESVCPVDLSGSKE